MVKLFGFYITRYYDQAVCTTTCRAQKCQKAKVAHTNRIKSLFRELQGKRLNNLKVWEPKL